MLTPIDNVTQDKLSGKRDINSATPGSYQSSGPGTTAVDSDFDFAIDFDPGFCLSSNAGPAPSPNPGYTLDSIPIKYIRETYSPALNISAKLYDDE
ncbi:hypothetical protein EVAR_21430_1 [Eumeta japonica]|uniref:Uncharacterized protein n=1 Tax=Eumeta variegata TaxID=151549 RepID=A0A4C1VJL2_EUMVA|nr:hypothetical protein EVAR_21430_1 [Eumeta japonica]